MTDFKADFLLLTKDDCFSLTHTLKNNNLTDALDEAKRIAFTEYRDNVIALKVYNDKQIVSMEF